MTISALRNGLQLHLSQPWQEKMWCIPHVNAEYVARMEDVLDLYAAAPDRQRPLVCFDEPPRQLIGEAPVPIPVEPWKPRRVPEAGVRIPTRASDPLRLRVRNDNGGVEGRKNRIFSVLGLRLARDAV